MQKDFRLPSSALSSGSRCRAPCWLPDSSSVNSLLLYKPLGQHTHKKTLQLGVDLFYKKEHANNFPEQKLSRIPSFNKYLRPVSHVPDPALELGILQWLEFLVYLFPNELNLLSFFFLGVSLIYKSFTWQGGLEPYGYGGRPRSCL